MMWWESLMCDVFLKVTLDVRRNLRSGSTGLGFNMAVMLS